MKTHLKKLSKSSSQFLLMIIALAVLMIPALTISYAENTKTSRVLSVQDGYYGGVNPGITEPINQTIAKLDYNVQTVLGNETNADYFVFSTRSGGSISTRRTAYFDNAVNYIGNNTYDITPDISAFTPDSDYYQIYPLVALSTTPADFAEYDFIRIATNIDIPIRIFMPTTINTINTIGLPHESNPGEYIIVNTLSVKSLLQTYPNATLYLGFMGLPGYFNSSYNGSFTFTAEMFNLVGTDQMTWQDSQIYILTILGCDILLIVGFVFTTNFIDIEIDKSGKRKRTYRKRRKSKR